MVVLRRLHRLSRRRALLQMNQRLLRVRPLQILKPPTWLPRLRLQPRPRRLGSQLRRARRLGNGEPPASSNASRATITAAPNRCENLAVDLDSFEVITPPRVSSGLPGRDPELGVTGPCEVVPSIKVSSYVETVLISDQSGSAPSRDQCGNGLPLSRGQALVLPASGWTACFVTDGGRTAAVGTTELSSRLIELDVAIY